MTETARTRIELLAPARNADIGIEAIKHGADAVYIGAEKFGARAAAGNSVDDIRWLVDFAHPYGAKVYVTLNTILYDHETEAARQLMTQLKEAGVDALIVQDMSLLEDSPIPLHASTQMDNRTAERVAWLRDLGFRQVVLARELTLDEIRHIHQAVPEVKLEVFVHGAICVSYNGQCYASQYCFGRSANRGECAQFCRMPFDLVDENGKVLARQKHLLSLRDMNRSDHLEALLDAGVTSLKIEGRLKDVSYVKNVVAYYRQRLNDIFQRNPRYVRSSLGHEQIAFTPSLQKSFNRLFTDYFLSSQAAPSGFLDQRSANMANIHTPKNMGERLTAKSQLHSGDGICYLDADGQLKGFRLNHAEDCLSLQRRVSREEGLDVVLYRNHDQQFEQELMRPTAVRRVWVNWQLSETPEGFCLLLRREDGCQVEQHFDYAHELARSPQRTPIENQLSRLGDTPYECAGVEIVFSDNLFIPGSVLAQWRRTLVERMLAQPVSIEDETHNSLDKHQKKEPKVIDVPASSVWMGDGRQPVSHISYLGNVANRSARNFYLARGVKSADWAMEVSQPEAKKSSGEVLLMTCRYCIRHELGLCPLRQAGTHEKGSTRLENPSSPLFLRLSDGRRFRLRFDCKKCQMLVCAN